MWTETSGLSYNDHHIVGVCISCGKNYSKESYVGYYLPIRHEVGTNLPIDSVVEVTQHILDNYKTTFWNRNFDAFFLEKEGITIPFVGGMNDGQIMAHLSTNESFPALKAYSRNYLKWDMIDFSENNAKDSNFASTDPSVSFVYAAGDALATVMISRKLWDSYPYIRKIYAIDNKSTEAVRLLSKTEIPS